MLIANLYFLLGNLLATLVLKYSTARSIMNLQPCRSIAVNMSIAVQNGVACLHYLNFINLLDC